MDESSSLARYEGDIKRFLKNVVSQLPVSSSEVQVSLGMFAATSRTVFDLDDILQKDAVLTAIDRASFHGGSGNTNEALKYVITYTKLKGKRNLVTKSLTKYCRLQGFRLTKEVRSICIIILSKVTLAMFC